MLIRCIGNVFICKRFSRLSLSPTCRSPSLQISSHWWRLLLHLCLSSFLWCSASPKSLRKDWFVAISWNKLNLQQLLYLFPVTLQSVTLHYITISWNQLNLQQLLYLFPVVILTSAGVNRMRCATSLKMEFMVMTRHIL